LSPVPGLFLSYRSGDDDFGAALIEDRLRSVFGDGSVFKDNRASSAGPHIPPELWRRNGDRG